MDQQQRDGCPAAEDAGADISAWGFELELWPSQSSSSISNSRRLSVSTPLTAATSTSTYQNDDDDDNNDADPNNDHPPSLSHIRPISRANSFESIACSTSYSSISSISSLDNFKDEGTRNGNRIQRSSSITDIFSLGSYQSSEPSRRRRQQRAKSTISPNTDTKSRNGSSPSDIWRGYWS
jgi:hypothetical protein